MSTRPTPATPSASEPELRLARSEELDAAGRLTSRVYLGDGFLGPEDGYLRRLEDAASRAREAELWVAVDDGALLGTVTFCPAGSAYREIGREGEGEFRMLAVRPEARGRGIGAALVGLCVRRSRDLGYAGVRMSTMDRMHAAHRVYERLGFTRAPEDDWRPEPGVLLLAYALAFDVTG